MGQISLLRPDPDMFIIQCFAILRDKQLDKLLLTDHNRKVLKKFKYFTRLRPVFKAHKDEIDTEDNLALWVYKHYGYGEFGVMFTSNYNKNKWGRLNKEGKLKKSTKGRTPRAYIEIVEGYNPDLNENFNYRYDYTKHKMHLMPFWKGKVTKKVKQQELPQIKRDTIFSDEEINEI